MLRADESMTEAVRRVEANPTSVAIGMFNVFSPSPYRLIGTVLVRPSRSVMYDWSRCYLQDGIADAEFGKFMSSCRDAAPYAELGEFVASFAPPRAFTGLGALLKPNKIRGALKNEKFMCDCGDFCTLATIIARYMREVARFERARCRG